MFMWILKKPSLAEAKKDIDVVIDHSRNLDDREKPLLEKLYDDYDNGQGEATAAQLFPLESKKNIIKGQYDKTSGKKSDGYNKPLVYIRTELNRGVAKCPYCSINAPQQLDHYMDKNDYGQLATCRLNLVPLCATCNNLKGKTSYKEFTHPYYQKFPKADFLVADCKVQNNHLVVKFRIDPMVITDVKLRAKLNNQISHIHLCHRLQKAVNEFLLTHFMYCVGFSDISLKTYLQKLFDNMNVMYGRNDWRTALLRGLLACASFNMNVVNNMKFVPVNDVGA